VAGYPGVDVMLMSATEIAVSLREGDVHLGVTGEDLVRESAPESSPRICLVHSLGFGFANVVVAVPRAWIDVSTMADLDDVCAAFAHRHRRRLRVATKYVHLTRAFFAHAGITDYRIVESVGATEAAPAAGTAEVVVDITTTGATLAANGLKTLDDGLILESQAQLAASLTADWGAQERATAEALMAQLGARERAKTSHVLRARLDAGAQAVVTRLAEAGVSVLAQPAVPGGDYAFLCPRARLSEAMAALGAVAAATVQDVNYVFDGTNPLYAKLAANLTASSSS
jgi:ATP phosphoribosyltransferase